MTLFAENIASAKRFLICDKSATIAEAQELAED